MTNLENKVEESRSKLDQISTLETKIADL